MNTEKLLLSHGQEHVLRHLKELGGEERKHLEAQIAAIDWSIFESLHSAASPETGDIRPIKGISLSEAEANKAEYIRAGKEAVKCGKVAAVLLAGGQGTRLGSSSPKGAYNIGVNKPLYIFEQLIRNLQETCKVCEAAVPLLIMTSEKNDAETRAFFKAHGYFGYPESHVRFFVQSMAPSVDEHGKLLFEDRGKLVLSPNGNGGWYDSLARAGLLQDELLVNCEWFNVFAVDNVLQRIADPAFVGATVLSGKMSGAKVVRKTRPEERVGVLCLKDGLPSVIEYYELSEDLANLRDESGKLAYSYGVTLNYLFHAQTLKQIAEQKIPVHVAKKKIAYWNGAETIQPQTENGYKFETLILDMIQLMGSCLPYEIEREKEFAPVKNLTGVDSVESARGLLIKNGVEL